MAARRRREGAGAPPRRRTGTDWCASSGTITGRRSRSICGQTRDDAQGRGTSTNTYLAGVIIYSTGFRRTCRSAALMSRSKFACLSTSASALIPPSSPISLHPRRNPRFDTASSSSTNSSSAGPPPHGHRRPPQTPQPTHELVARLNLSLHHAHAGVPTLTTPSTDNSADHSHIFFRLLSALDVMEPHKRAAFAAGDHVVLGVRRALRPVRRRCTNATSSVEPSSIHRGRPRPSPSGPDGRSHHRTHRRSSSLDRSGIRVVAGVRRRRGCRLHASTASSAASCMPQNAGTAARYGVRMKTRRRDVASSAGGWSGVRVVAQGVLGDLHRDVVYFADVEVADDDFVSSSSPSPRAVHGAEGDEFVERATEPVLAPRPRGEHHPGPTLFARRPPE